MEVVGDAEIVLRFVKCGRMFGYSVRSLKNYDWVGNKVIFQKVGLPEGYGHRIFASEGLGAAKKARYSVGLVKDQEMCFSVVWFAKAFPLLRLRCGIGGEERGWLLLGTLT